MKTFNSDNKSCSEYCRMLSNLNEMISEKIKYFIKTSNIENNKKDFN